MGGLRCEIPCLRSVRVCLDNCLLLYPKYMYPDVQSTRKRCSKVL